MNNPAIQNLFKPAEASLGTARSAPGTAADAAHARGTQARGVGTGAPRHAAPADARDAADSSVQAPDHDDDGGRFHNLLSAQQDGAHGAGADAAATTRAGVADATGTAVASGPASTTARAMARGAATQDTDATASERPVDLLKLLSELEAAERAGTAPGDAAATTALPDAALKSVAGQDDDADADADTVIADSPLNPLALLRLLESAAATGGAATSAAAAAAAPTLAGAAGSTLAGGDATNSVLLNVGSGATPGAALGMNQSLTPGADAALLAQQSDTQAAPDATGDTALTAAGGSDATFSKVTLQNFGADANGATLQVTQFSAPHADSSASGSAQPVTERTLSIPVGQRGWSEQVGTQVQWLVDHKVQSARLQVTPDGMGPIEVHLSVDRNDVNVNFVAQHSETRDSLEQSIPQLRAMLAGSGLSLGQATVQQQSQQAQHHAPVPNAANRDADHNDESVVAAPSRASVGLVDEYA
ncbi:MAG: flagellar hook-length control protein FliK [Steroidobacteraceae bacterium]